MRNYQCLEGFADCTNVTFTGSSIGASNSQGYGLLPGYGCYIKIDRTEDGSYGTVAIQYDDPSILVFDQYNRQYVSG